MLPELTSAELSARRRQISVRNLEAGQTSAFHLGRDELFLDHTLGLASVQYRPSNLANLAAPAVIAGGVGPLWIALLLRRSLAAAAPSAAPAMNAPGVRVIYGGGDPATVLAARALYADGDRPLSRAAYIRPPARLPAALVPPIAPRAEPVPAFNWSEQPLWEMARAREAAAAAERSPLDQPEDWSAYLTIMLAVVLLLAALAVSLTS